MKPTTPTLSELLENSEWLRRLARSLVRDDAQADDLVQETWMAALAHPPPSPETARAWLRKILRNLVRMKARAHTRRRRREQVALEGAIGAESSHERLERIEAQRLLATLVLDLPEPYRSTIMLRYYEGMSAAEVAAREHVPAGTVRWRLREGLERLRSRLDKGHGGDRKAWLGGFALLGGVKLVQSATQSLMSSTLVAAACAAALLIGKPQAGMPLGTPAQAAVRRPESGSHSPSRVIAQASPPARDGTPRYTKREADIPAQRTEPATSTPAEKKKVGPRLGPEQFSAGIQTKIADVNELIIKRTNELIDRTDDNDPQKAELIYRLAELFNEKRQYYDFKARSLDEKIFKASLPGEKERMKREQAGFDREATKWLFEATRAYLRVANGKQFQQYPKMDEVLFYLGYMLQQVKRTDDARVYFGRLVKEHQGSRFVPDAYLSFAEYYFQAGDMNAALQFYDKIAKFPKSRVFGFAQYKSAWCYYNLKEFDRSLRTFIDLLEKAKQGQLDNTNRAAIERESQKDVVLVYSQIGTPEKAWNFFQRVGGDYAPKMEQRLAELYWEQGKFIDSIKIYHELMRLFPDSARLCEWQYNVVKGALSAGNKRDQTQEMQRLAAVYDRYNRGEQRQAKSNDITECKSNSADKLRELATTWHREAQTTRNLETYALAQYIYKEYIERFPTEKDAYDMNWYYGELLFKLGEEERDSAKQRWYFEKAAEQYTRVVKFDPKGKHLKDAALAAVLSYQNASAAKGGEMNVVAKGGVSENCVMLETAESSASKGKDKEKRKEKQGCADAKPLLERPDLQAKPIPKDKQRMLDAFDLYLTFVTNKDTNDDQMIRMKYQRARLYYEYNHFDKAAPLFAEIADKHPKHEVGPISANLLIDCLNIMARTDALARSCDRFLASPDLMRDQDLKRVCVEQRGSVKWVKADAEKRAGRYKNAGKLFLEIFNDNPQAPKAVQVLYNAALMYDAARLVGQAIRIRQNLIKLFPNTPEAQKALYQIAENFQGIALYERAAENFESFAIKYPGEKESAAALGNATFFRRGLGQDDKAIKDNGDFIRFYGQRKPAEAAGVFFSIGDIYAKEKKWDQVVRHYQEFLSRYGSKRPDLQVVAHVRMGEILWRQSCPVGDGVNGACVKLERVQAGGAASDLVTLTRGKKMRVKSRTQCGPETKSKITLVKRNETKAHEAQKHFAAALAVYKSHAGSVGGANEAERAERTEIMNDAAAHARFMQGEALFEKMLSIPFPDHLVFSSNPALKRQDTESKRRFATWLKEKEKILESARAVYLDVLPFKQAHWTIASSARVGQLFQNLADGLYTAPIPSPAQLITDLKKIGATDAQVQEYVGQFREHFCDQLVDHAEKPEAKAIDALRVCLGKATELSWFNEWSRLCEAELNQIKASEYPLASEMRAEPGYAAARVDDGILVEHVE